MKKIKIIFMLTMFLGMLPLKASAVTRFIDNGDGTISDKQTGLMWLKDTTCLHYTWLEAYNLMAMFNANPASYCTSTYSASYADWRMPTKTDFEPFVGIAADLRSAGFINLNSVYWTQTVYPLNSGNYYTFDSSISGSLWYSYNANNAYLWPTRKWDVTAPTGTISINSGISSTTSTAVSLTLSCDDGTGTGCSVMRFSNDGVSWSTSEAYATNKVWTLTSSEGTKTVYVIFTDNAGNGSSYIDTIIFDTTAPTTSASHAGGTYNSTLSVTLSCSDSTGAGCDKIYYTVNGDTPTTSSAVYSGQISISATATLKFFAIDLIGNSEAVKSMTYTIDTTAPTGTISINSGVAYTNATGATMTLSCADTNGCAQMQFSNDNTNWSTAETYATSKSWTLTTGDGTKTVYVKFKDGAGNWSTGYSDTIILDATAPTVSAGGNKTTNTSFTQTATATDANAMTYSWTKQSGTGAISFGSSNALSTTVSASADGTYTLRFTSTDAAGNSAYSDMTLVWDTVAPDTTITAQPVNPTNSTSASFSFASIETGSTFQCQLDSGGYSSCASPKAYSGLAAGNHTFYLKATDAAGNTDPTPASYMWAIDTIAPTVSINTVTTPTNSTGQTITGTVETGATVNIATDTAASDGAATVTGTTWSYTITGLVAGINNITVTATDAAGNTATATSAIALDTTSPAFSSTSPSSNSFINTATVGYSLSKAVSSGSVTFTRTGGTADSSAHLYDFTSSDITAGSHSINTGLVLVNGAIYTLTVEATDSAGNTGSVSNTNVTYDTTSGSVTINSPASNSVVNNAKASYTLSEDISAGNILFTRTDGTADGMSPYTYTMSSSDRTKGSHTVDTGKMLMDGAIYTVSFVNVMDMAGNSTAPVSNTNVKYDITAVAITNTTPASSSIITNSTISYTLSEQALSGKVTFTRTGGAADAGSPHLYNLMASDMTAGVHNINTNLALVDGAFYTVSFDATDLVGNPATTVSNAMVYYDSNYGIGPAGNVDNISYSNKRVDGYDLIKLSIAFGSQSGNVNWSPVCDLNGDGKIDGNDLIVLGNHFGEVQ